MLLPAVLVNLDFLKPHISNFILNQIKSKVNAQVEFTNPNYKFKRNKLHLSADRINFKQNQETILDLKNFKLAYPLKNIFRSRQIITNISADKLFIKAIREDDAWNLESIMKPGKKEVDFLFHALSFHDTDLEIYSKDYFEKENVYLDIHKDKTTQLYQVEFYNQHDLSSISLDQRSKLSGENKFYISGQYDLNNNQGVYKYVKNLNVALHKLKPNLINLLSRAFTDRKSRFLSLFNKYSSQDSQLNLFVKELKDKDEYYSLDLFINNLMDKENFSLKSNFQLGTNVNILDFDLKFLEAQLRTKGKVFEAFSTNPKLDLDLKLLNFNPYLFRNSIPEIKSLISDKIARFTSTLHKSPVFNAAAKINGDFLYPNLSLNLPILSSNASQNLALKELLLDLNFRKQDYLIQKLKIPFEFADLLMNGSIAKTGTVDLKLKTQDFPIRSLKPIAASFLPEEHVRAIKDLVIQGYLKSDLEIKKQDAKSLPEFFGNIVLAETSILEPHIPLLLQDISTNLNVEKDIIKVSSFSGLLYENKVDLNGYYNIHSNNYQLNLSSPNFDLSKIEGYRIKKYIPNVENFKNIRGNIKNLEISSSTDTKNIATAGELVDIAFDYATEKQIVNLKKLNAGFAFVDSSLTINGLQAYINDSASLALGGIYDFNKSKTDISAQAMNLPFSILSVFEINGMPLVAKDGTTSFDLAYKDNKLTANGDFHKLAFNLNDKTMPENFRAVNGEFAINDDLHLNDLSAFYGNTFIKAKNFTINNFFSNDKYYDIDLKSDIKVSEFKSFIPQSITELLKIEGYLPLHIKAKGDTQKFYLNIDGNLDKVDKLAFADWLDYDTKVKGDFTTSFSFTPKLILSKNTMLNLRNETSKTSVAADFEIHDWKEKRELRYSIDAYTPLDSNGNFIAVNLDLIEPHIKSIETLNLDAGTGYMQCRTDGALDSRHTFCDIEFLDQAVARNFGIGDLTSEHSSVYLISVKDKPVYVKVKLFDGIWNVLDYTRVKFDMEITESLMKIDRLRAKLNDGFIRSNIAFDFNTLESKFKIKGNNVSAHKAAESFFALGHEVPQGTVSGQFEGKTKGLLPDEMFFNLEATASALVHDGKLSSLKTMQKLLSAINTLKNFDFNNVFQTLITYKGGLFSDMVTEINFDKGKLTTEKLLLHSEQIELHLEGNIDYAKDYLMIRGLGAVPERSKSFLQLLGIKDFNLGNLLSIINLRNPGSKDKDYFAFSMKGPVNDLEEATQSLRQNFTWLRSYGSSD